MMSVIHSDHSDMGLTAAQCLGEIPAECCAMLLIVQR